MELRRYRRWTRNAVLQSRGERSSDVKRQSSDALALRRDCHPISPSRTHDFRFRGRVRLPIVTNWPRARRIGDNRKTYASLRVRVTQAESTHESTSNGRTWLRATSQARGVITSPSRRRGRVNMRLARPGRQRPQLRRTGKGQAERPRPRAPGRVCTRRGIQGLKSLHLPRRCSQWSGQAGCCTCCVGLLWPDLKSAQAFKILVQEEAQKSLRSCRVYTVYYSAEVQRASGPGSCKAA